MTIKKDDQQFLLWKERMNRHVATNRSIWGESDIAVSHGPLCQIRAEKSDPPAVKQYREALKDAISTVVE